MGPMTREPQYQHGLDMARQTGFARFGIMTNQAWRDDPRHLLFVLSRYKFVAKMLSGKERVLEVGCADAFGTRLVMQEVGAVTVLDFDPVFIDDTRKRMDTDGWQCECRLHDILDGPIAENFDAAYSLDVFEHISREDENRFIQNIANSVVKTGAVIFGSPSLQSQAYASRASREGHINCKDGKDWKRLLEKHFDNVFLFSMNDEVVHTGFHAMAHYQFMICTGRKQ